MNGLTGIFRENHKLPIDLLTVAAVTVIGFAIVIFATRQIAGQSPHSILIRLDLMRIFCFSSAD